MKRRWKKTRIFPVFCMVLLVGCATVDPKPALRQTEATFEQATGSKAAWAELPPPRELTPGADGILTLRDALALALVNNRALRADLEVIAQLSADVVQAGLLTNPILSVMTGFPEAGGRAAIAFGLSKDFAELWLIPERRRAAQAMLQQRVLEVANTAVNLVADVTIAYHELAYEHHAIELRQKNLAVLRESLETTQVRLRTGSGTQLEVNLIHGQLGEAEVTLEEARAGYRMAQRRLMRLMGVARADDGWQPEPQTVDMSQVDEEESLAVEAALLQRLDVQAARWELESAMADLETERREVFPMLNVGIGGERFERRASPGRDVLADTIRATTAAGGTLTAPEIQSAAERQQARRQEIDFVLGPSFEVTLPIFDQNQAQIARAHYRARELLERLAEVEQDVAEGMRTALTQHRLNMTRVRIFRESLVPIEQSNVVLARSAYQSGKESISTILLAQEALIRTQLAQAAAERDLANGLAELAREAGGRWPVVGPGTTPMTDPKPN